MAEWSNVAVSKSVVPQGTGGSNPSLSAINLDNQRFTKYVHRLVHESPPESLRFRGLFRTFLDIYNTYIYSHLQSMTPIIIPYFSKIYGHILDNYNFTSPRSIFLSQSTIGARLK